MAITQTGTNNNLTENNTKEEQPVHKFHSGIERQQRLERNEKSIGWTELSDDRDSD